MAFTPSHCMKNAAAPALAELSDPAAALAPVQSRRVKRLAYIRGSLPATTPLTPNGDEGEGMSEVVAGPADQRRSSTVSTPKLTKPPISASEPPPQVARPPRPKGPLDQRAEQPSLQQPDHEPVERRHSQQEDEGPILEPQIVSDQPRRDPAAAQRRPQHRQRPIAPKLSGRRRSDDRKLTPPPPLSATSTGAVRSDLQRSV